ncbi:2-hydroxy-6-oxononadienedioate/2-hydroxy-6-oxononatrienedioate hydrolase 1-like protein [Corchorus olitorius]|uniref:2-hydroxy-6-oxononadienedioate/2-hydroxy-6-oxononatrienedioate hydrolase 1-like protein n=1 Tax=Corchorus olitorius TaxID=93759 RepID=A0A1R3H708_9ROSI|nr:2-hydroxy-6-oxononadienedioate/2-hydroxy-6-oxononatrienedioate hydrolase 1-like protein [Corchorus olitorius]
MESTKLWHVISLYLSTALAIFRNLLHLILNINRTPFLTKSMDTLLSLYFRLCDLSPCAIDLDDKTTIHFWVPNHRRFHRPSLVMIHGYGGNSLWQFLYQVGPLSRKFNVYIPDLLFFGKSYSKALERSEAFQAKCMVDGLQRLGVEKFSVYAISYGGFVAYKVAEMWPDAVEKVVIVSSGIVYTDEQRDEHLKRLGRHPSEILVPKNPVDLKLLVNLSMSKPTSIYEWIPDFLLREFIIMMYDHCRKEKVELAEHLVGKKADSNLPVLTQALRFKIKAGDIEEHRACCKYGVT